MALASAASVAIFAQSSEAAAVHGVQLPENAVKVGDDRFKAKEDWDKTLRFFRNAYGKQAGVVFRSIASTPRVKAYHIANIRKGQSWEGINVYETNGEVFIFVIKAERAESKRPSGKG